jgi:hypothetical protein
MITALGPRFELARLGLGGWTWSSVASSTGPPLGEGVYCCFVGSSSDRPRTGAVQGTSVGLLVFRGVPPTWLSSLSEGPARPLFRPVGVVQESSVGAWPLIFMGKVCSVGVYGSTTTSISASLTACESSEEGGELVMIDIEDPEPRPVSIE